MHVAQEYMQEIATCLLQMAKCEDERVTQQMNQLTSEAINIVGLRTRIDGTTFAPVISFDTTEGNSLHIDEGFYKRILVIFYPTSRASTAMMCTAQMYYVHCYQQVDTMQTMLQAGRPYATLHCTAHLCDRML